MVGRVQYGGFGWVDGTNVQKMGWFKLHKAPRSMAVLDSFGGCWRSENGEKIIAKNWKAQEGVQFFSAVMYTFHEKNPYAFHTFLLIWKKRLNIRIWYHNKWFCIFTPNLKISIFLGKFQHPISKNSHTSRRPCVQSCVAHARDQVLNQRSKKKSWIFPLPVYPKSSFFKFGLVVFPDFFFQNLRFDDRFLVV